MSDVKQNDNGTWSVCHASIKSDGGMVTDLGQPGYNSKLPLQEPKTVVLDIAKQVVYKDRAATYGKVEDNFSTIAELWNVYLNNKATELSAIDVANMMILLKVARSATGKFNLDNYVDIAGYAECAALTQQE